MAINVFSANGMGGISLVGSSYVTTGMKVEDHMHFANAFLNSAGVVQSGDLAVTQNGTPNQSVNVAAGTGFILNASYTENSTSQTRIWGFVNDGTVNVALTANASGNPRITSIFAKFDTGATPDGDASNVVTFVAVDGTPAVSPVAPATPSNYLRLADITCANGYTSITNANISDQRVQLNMRKALPAGTIVGTSDTQTLTNKTYDTPTIWNFDGWNAANETWTYASTNTYTNTNTVYTGSFTISGDKTTKYSAGMRVKFTQTTVKYGIITSVAYGAPNTTVIVFFGTDYSIANAAITLPFYSTMKSPFGFPLDPSKWTLQFQDTSNRNQASPVQNQWYCLNTNAQKISLPIGFWDMIYMVCANVGKNATTGVDVVTSLSTSNNSVSDVDFTASFYIGGASGTFALQTTAFRNKKVLLGAPATYYLIIRTSQTGASGLDTYGVNSPTTINALCAYL